MKTTTILLLIATAGLATACHKNNKTDDRYNYSDTTYRPSEPYYPSTSSTSSTTTTNTSRSMDTGTQSGSTVWHSSTDSQNVNRNQTNMNRDQSNLNQNRTGNTQDQQKQSGQLRSQDQDFLKQAAIDGQKEVEWGRLAVRQGSNEKVRNFGQMLIDDHTKANDELTTLARQKNVDVSTQRTAQDRSQFEKFGQLQGADFDKQFIDQMIQDHQKAIDLFDRQSRTGDDQQVKAFASRNLPTLRSHLQMAKDIQSDLNASGMGVPNRAPSSTPGTDPYRPRDPNQPIQPFDPNNPNAPRNPNNPDPLNPTNPVNPSDPNSPR